MTPFLRKMFPGRKNKKTKEFIQTISNMSKLEHEIHQKQEELESIEYNLLMKDKESVFISLSDFISLLDIQNLSLADILKKCKHISELQPKNFSIVEVYSIVEDNHIVLCPDITECTKHNSYKGNKIRIVTIRR